MCRQGMAMFGVLQVVTSFLTVWEVSRSLSAACITAVLVVSGERDIDRNGTQYVCARWGQFETKHT